MLIDKGAALNMQNSRFRCLYMFKTHFTCLNRLIYTIFKKIVK